jgi:hypothetical protein
VLIVSGDGDPFVDAAMIASAIARASEAHARDDPQAGHWPHVEQPAVLARVIGDFVRTLDAASGRQRGAAGLESRVRQQVGAGVLRRLRARHGARRDRADPSPRRPRAVKTVMGTASSIYESVTFTTRRPTARAPTSSGRRQRSAAGAARHHHPHQGRRRPHRAGGDPPSPLGAALRFSAELGKRLDGAIPSDYFHAAA